MEENKINAAVNEETKTAENTLETIVDTEKKVKAKVKKVKEKIKEAEEKVEATVERVEKLPKKIKEEVKEVETKVVEEIKEEEEKAIEDVEAVLDYVKFELKSIKWGQLLCFALVFNILLFSFDNEFIKFLFANVGIVVLAAFSHFFKK